MKKRIIAILLAALLLMTACGKASDTPAPTEDTQPTSGSTPTQSTDAPAEPPTSAPTDVPTEPAATEPTPAPTEPEPEPSKDDLSYYPYRLFDMSINELKKEVDPSEYLYIKYGGSPTYRSPLGYVLTFYFSFEFPANPVPLSDNALLTEIEEIPDGMIYPGIEHGMPLSELSQKVDWISFGYNTHGPLEDFCLCALVDGYALNVYFATPEEFSPLILDSQEEKDLKNIEAFGEWLRGEYQNNFQDVDIPVSGMTIYRQRLAGYQSLSEPGHIDYDWLDRQTKWKTISELYTENCK